MVPQNPVYTSYNGEQHGENNMSVLSIRIGMDSASILLGTSTSHGKHTDE
jgi:hypothetical protein